ncbi:MAG TPA: type III pantothenate kinase [Phycisphaerae bacterium]|nr:type III pantothenate kinase [Phycisphaerae bacterium]HON66694.1 type III pantothenate kinase [Phycisphaerae bacterium]HPU27500.1 type III pantothenate kinase [Phycisphaerae bacterium]HPZ96765.1 type III pantothenate kinase [Phycisphaerae bacterium]HQE30130.1 type III pantothenate kinase [Phycisphaerae bacterium]
MIAEKHNGNGQDSASGAHLVLVGIGNSRIAVASWKNDRRGAAQHFEITRLSDALDELQAIWNSFPAGVERAIVVSSVNPPRLAEFRTECKTRHLEPLLVVGDELDLPLPVDLPEPGKVGTDRLCAAAAAFAKVKSACVVADFGTAVTIDLVADDGAFLGGAILPGMAMSARALHEYTAQLPLVELSPPTEIVGKNTVSAIRGGISAMMTGALREITERYATDIGKWPPLIVTGGDAETIAAACDFIDRVVPDLALDGLVIAYQATKSKP